MSGLAGKRDYIYRKELKVAAFVLANIARRLKTLVRDCLAKAVKCNLFYSIFDNIEIQHLYHIVTTLDKCLRYFASNTV